MHSIKQIGKIALSRLLGSRKFNNYPGEDANILVEFPDGCLDLSSLEIPYQRDDSMGVQYRGGGGYSVWGIELGLRTLTLNSGDTAFDGLSKLLRGTDLPIPTHIIVHSWSNSDFHNVTTSTVYRLSQKQEELLEWLKKENRSVLAA